MYSEKSITDDDIEAILVEGLQVLEPPQLASLALNYYMLSTLGEAIGELDTPAWMSILERVDSENPRPNKVTLPPIQKPIDPRLSVIDYAMALDDDESAPLAADATTGTLLSIEINADDPRLRPLERHAAQLSGKGTIHLTRNKPHGMVVVTLGGFFRPGKTTERSIRFAPTVDGLAVASSFVAPDRFDPSWTIEVDAGLLPSGQSVVRIEYEDTSRKIHVYLIVSIA